MPMRRLWNWSFSRNGGSKYITLKLYFLERATTLDSNFRYFHNVNDYAIHACSFQNSNNSYLLDPKCAEYIYQNTSSTH